MINYINIKVDYLIFIVIINKLLVFNISKYMNSLSASQYTNHTNDIYISINPTYINKASKTNKMELLFNGRNLSQDLFVWSYKITISNESSSALTLAKYELKTISETGIIRDFFNGDESNRANFSNKMKLIKPESIIESNEIIVLPCRSAILFGKFIFSNIKKDVDLIVNIGPVSLDSKDSKNMAN